MSKIFIKKIIRVFLCLWIGLIFILPNVKAELDADSYDHCYDKFLLGYFDGTNWLSDHSVQLFGISPIPFQSHTTYYFRYFPDESDSYKTKFYRFTPTFDYLDPKANTTTTVYFDYPSYGPTSSTQSIVFRNTFSFTTGESDKMYFGLRITDAHIPPNGYLIYSTASQEELMSCPVIEEPEPEKPSFESVTLSNLFSLYTSKLTEVNIFALNNDFFMLFFAIILLFITLEIILYLLKGRR